MQENVSRVEVTVDNAHPVHLFDGGEELED